MSIFRKKTANWAIGSLELPPERWQRHVAAASGWLRRSMAVTGGQGSAHSFSLRHGWSAAYPETTGYLIETLLRYADGLQDPALGAAARRCGAWLLDIQMPDGAYPGLLAGSTRPSVFNTGQILFGLAALAERDGDPEGRYRAALQRACAWMLRLLEPDGAWRQAAYVPGFVPSYLTRAVWGLLRANQILQNPDYEAAMRHALRYYALRFLPDGSVADCGFRAGEAAFTHTIAYTLEGFWESALLLGEADILDKTLRSAGQLLAVCQAEGGMAGRYGDHWRSDQRFICCTGHAQFSLLFQRLGAHTGDTDFRRASDALLAALLPLQSRLPLPGTRGALPGSWPLWGAYLPFRYPNWAQKFFLDALWHHKP
jgi:hypothetical protein